MQRAVWVLCLIAVLASCSGEAGNPHSDAGDTVVHGTEEPRQHPVELPPGRNLYRPPMALASGRPGTLVWFDERPSPVPGARAWRTLSRSRSADGRAILVSGVMFRPSGPPPSGGFPVITWAGGTTGLADRCAPSKWMGSVPALGDFLDAGFVVVETDGQGLGTPGPSAYLVGESEGHTILDAARAATALPDLDASSRVGLWGYSAGGHGVLSAARQASDYAPELTIIGIAAIAPVVDVSRFASRVTTYFGFTFVTLGAWSEIYGIDPSAIFAERPLAQLQRLDSECASTYLFDWFMLRVGRRGS